MVERSSVQGVPDFIGAGVERLTAELPREQHVTASAPALTTDDGQLGISVSKPGKDRWLLRRRQLSANIDEWTSGADRRELARIADEHETLHALNGVEECRELILREHRALVDDDSSVALLPRRRRIPIVAAACAIIAIEALEELCERLALAEPAGGFLHSNPRLSRWRE